MRATQVSIASLLILPTLAQVTTSDPCTTTTSLPTITISRRGPEDFINVYTRVYDELCPEGLRPKTYAVTLACATAACQPPPIETAPPPGFTCAVVQCAKCGPGGGPQSATLTFPKDSVAAYTSSGYQVHPTGPPVQSGDEGGRVLGQQNSDGDKKGPDADADGGAASPGKVDGGNSLSNGSTGSNGADDEGSGSLGGSSDNGSKEGGNALSNISNKPNGHAAGNDTSFSATPGPGPTDKPATVNKGDALLPEIFLFVLATAASIYTLALAS